MVRLLTSPLVCALEEDWRHTLDGVARSFGLSPSNEIARLAAQVERLSAAYNDASSVTPRPRDVLGARLGFSFVRDVPKGAAAVRELVATGLLRLDRSRPLRVLDVGAGLGATSWGLVRALEADGQSGPIEATWVDADEAALRVGVAIVKDRAGTGRVELGVRTASQALDRPLPPLESGPFDVVLLGQVLSELDRHRSEGRLERHVALVRSLLDRSLDAGGSLVIVEPALRERTRHLHCLRDALLAAGAVTVFAPCLHEAPCPALAAPGDWCHEDLGVDLPAWLWPVARAAGLRWQGLTFSYLVLRKDGRSLRDAVPARGALVRVVSGPLVSKGKREGFVCGGLSADSGVEAGRVRAVRLDRDRTVANEAWGTAARGDLFDCDPPLTRARPRVTRETHVAVETPAAPHPSRRG